MEKQTVKIINNTNNRISVNVPEMRFSRQWLKKGSSVQVEKDTLEELLYDTGFKYMIDNTMLYIEDMEVKKELGLEPENAKEPQNLIALSDNQMRHYMVTMPLETFKEKINSLKYEQIMSLADYAIENKLSDFNKCEIIKKLCGKDIIKAIQLDIQAQED